MDAHLLGGADRIEHAENPDVFIDLKTTDLITDSVQKLAENFINEKYPDIGPERRQEISSLMEIGALCAIKAINELCEIAVKRCNQGGH